MATFKAKGICLLTRKYRATECVATFFTREYGKVEAVAKGLGKPASSLAPAVEPLTLSRLFFARGRNLDHLTQAEVINPFYDLRTNMWRLAYAGYAAELIASTTEPQQAHPELFDLLEATISAMENSDDPQKLAMAYALRLLGAQGVGPVTQECVECGQQIDGHAVYSPRSGGLLCAACRLQHNQGGLEISAATRGMLRSLLTMPFERLGRLRLDAAMRRQITGLLRQHIEYHLGIRLKSEQFLDKLRGAGGTDD